MSTQTELNTSTALRMTENRKTRNDLLINSNIPHLQAGSCWSLLVRYSSVTIDTTRPESKQNQSTNSIKHKKSYSYYNEKKDAHQHLYREENPVFRTYTYITASQSSELLTYSVHSVGKVHHSLAQSLGPTDVDGRGGSVFLPLPPPFAPLPRAEPSCVVALNCCCGCCLLPPAEGWR